MTEKCVGDCCLGSTWIFDCPCCEGTGEWETGEKCATCTGTGRMLTPRAYCVPHIEYPPMGWLEVADSPPSDPLAPEACPKCGDEKVLVVPRTGQRVRCSCVAMKDQPGAESGEGPSAPEKEGGDGAARLDRLGEGER